MISRRRPEKGRAFREWWRLRTSRFGTSASRRLSRRWSAVARLAWLFRRRRACLGLAGQCVVHRELAISLLVRRLDPWTFTRNGGGWRLLDGPGIFVFGRTCFFRTVVAGSLGSDLLGIRIGQGKERVAGEVKLVAKHSADQQQKRQGHHQTDFGFPCHGLHLLRERLFQVRFAWNRFMRACWQDSDRRRCAPATRVSWSSYQLCGTELGAPRSRVLFDFCVRRDDRLAS